MALATDLGLDGVDFGPGPFTVTALASLDAADLTEAALVEVAGLLGEQVAWLTSLKARALATLASRRGGVTDLDAAVEAAFEQGEGWRGGRLPVVAEWERELLSARCAISGAEARRQVLTAVALADRLPATAGALAVGAVSWRHAVELAAETEDLTVEQSHTVERRVLADRRAVTAGQFRFQARKHAAALRPEPEPAEVCQRRSLTAEQNRCGGVEIVASLTDEGGRLVCTALDALAAACGPEDVRRADERRADALVELAQTFLDGGHAPAGTSGVRPHLTLTIDTTPQPATTRGPTPETAPSDQTGPVAAGQQGPAGAAAAGPAGVAWAAAALAGVFGLGETQVGPATARRICCDTGVSVAGHDRGQLREVSRESRFPTAALRRRLELRDRHCRFPGCTRPPARCHAHHVQHWADGGPTSEANLLIVCARHHHAAHEGGWQLAFDGRTAFWTDPHGRSYDGRAPLAEPPHWDDDEPFPRPYQPPPPPRAGCTVPPAGGASSRRTAPAAEGLDPPPPRDDDLPPF